MTFCSATTIRLPMLLCIGTAVASCMWYLSAHAPAGLAVSECTMEYWVTLVFMLMNAIAFVLLLRPDRSVRMATGCAVLVSLSIMYILLYFAVHLMEGLEAARRNSIPQESVEGQETLTLQGEDGEGEGTCTGNAASLDTYADLAKVVGISLVGVTRDLVQHFLSLEGIMQLIRPPSSDGFFASVISIPMLLLEMVSLVLGTVGLTVFEVPEEGTHTKTRINLTSAPPAAKKGAASSASPTRKAAKKEQ